MKRLQTVHMQQLETLREEMQRQKTEADDAIEKSKEEMLDLLHEQTKEHSKAWNARRHTGSRSSAWHDKKRERAEKRQAEKEAAGSAASSGPPATVPANFCDNCGRGEAGRNCCRHMCRPCCTYFYQRSRRSERCPQHQPHDA